MVCVMFWTNCWKRPSRDAPSSISLHLPVTQVVFSKAVGDFKLERGGMELGDGIKAVIQVEVLRHNNPASQSLMTQNDQNGLRTCQDCLRNHLQMK